MKHVVMIIRLYSVFKVSMGMMHHLRSCEIMCSTLGVQNGVLECTHDMILGSGDLVCHSYVFVGHIFHAFIFLWDTVHKGSYCGHS